MREDGADRRQIVRLVQGRKRHIALEAGEHLRVYENRFVVLRAAMHDAVPDRAWRYPLLFPQPCTGRMQRRRHVGYGRGVVFAIDETRAIAAARS